MRAWLASLNRDLATLEVPTTLVATWCVWVPVTSVVSRRPLHPPPGGSEPDAMQVYSLPGELQVPLFNLALCFFVMILQVMQRRASRAGGGAKEPASPRGDASGV